MTRRDRLSTRLAAILSKYLGNRGSWSGDIESARSLEGHTVHWYFAAQRAGSRITFLETITTSDKSQRVVRYWLLSPDSDGIWKLEAAEKNHEPLEDEWINDELEETIGRLEDPQTARSNMEVPKARIKAPDVASPSAGLWPKVFKAVSSIAFFLTAFFILITVSSLQYYRMIHLVENLNASIGLSTTRTTQSISTLAQRLDSVDKEIEQLRDDVQRERAAFEFSRKSTAMRIRQQADELPWSDFSRKRAYNYIADRIESSASYGDIIYQISRLPADNKQAETLLAVDRANIIPLSDYVSAVPGLSYPVKIDGKEADGKDFMISSGFGELRPTSFGSGGYLPHMAVDIINVRNILMVTPGNTIVRYQGEPGSVIASYEGTVLREGKSNVYGWYAEVSHPLNEVWKNKYKGIKMLTTFYAHMAEDPGWKGGEHVKRNEKLGNIGATGRATGPHLHYEVRVYRDSGEFSGKYGRFDRINPFLLKD